LANYVPTMPPKYRVPAPVASLAKDGAYIAMAAIRTGGDEHMRISHLQLSAEAWKRWLDMSDDEKEEWLEKDAEECGRSCCVSLTLFSISRFAR